jgi:mono/diheme cytochrome c family protein
MTMFRTFGTVVSLTILAVGAAIAASSGDRTVQSESRTAAAPVPTFTHDVAPILYKNCVVCHRPGEIGPMSLISYQEVRPWARSIRKKTGEGSMPPWHADAPAGTFENERRLSEAEKDTIASWVAGGAPEGDPKDLPVPPEFTDGWRIGKPDVVLEMQEDYPVPASGTVQYEYLYIPTNFTEPKWIQAVEIRPGNRQVVHHALAFYAAPPDTPRAPPALKFPEHMELPPPVPGNRPERELKVPERLLATYAPGTDPQVFKPGTALRLAPGGTIKLQMHYTTNGTAATDRTKVGLIFAKQTPVQEMRVSQFFNTKFTIPAGAADYEVDSELGVVQDIKLYGVFPHTHLRGKKWEYKLQLPDGTIKQLLSVPRYDFNWQTYYMFAEPLPISKGSRILSAAWYDNSPQNASNPNPNSDVKWGDQTWEEMQYTGILFSIAGPPDTSTKVP